MKIVTSFLATQLIAVSAFAGNVTLTKTSNNGTVAPQYAKSTVCTISDQTQSGGSVLVSTIVHINFMHPPVLRPMEAVFTKDVPNAQVLESLAADAARAPVETNPGPIGGPTIAYSLAFDVGHASELQVQSGGVTIQKNHSEAAKKLLEFIDANCSN